MLPCSLVENLMEIPITPREKNVLCIVTAKKRPYLLVSPSSERGKKTRGDIDSGKLRIKKSFAVAF